jgi:uroporphyrinogen III methyltransferase/synthase
VLPNGLAELGCTVDVIRAYRSVSDGEGAEQLRDALQNGAVDLATFASASAVRGYVEAVGADLARRAPAASIGPVTSDALRAAGIDVVAEADEASIDGLVEAVMRCSSSFRPVC